MILFVLWLFTSSYAMPIGTLPDAKSCAFMAGATDAQFKLQAGPRPFLYRLACVPTVLPGTPRARDRPWVSS